LAAETSSSKLSAPAVLIILLAALGIGPPLFNGSRASNAQPRPTAPARPASSANRAQIEPRSALALLNDFFALDVVEKRASEPWSSGAGPATTRDRSWLRDDVRNGYSLTFLGATLPAPASPPLRYEFDAFLDALQLALGRAGYMLTSFALPWLGESGASGDGDKGGHAGAVRSIATGVSATPPGVLLFHRAGDKRLLVLFVVGETPTRGVDKAELRETLEQIAWLAGWKAPDDPARPGYLDAATRDFRAANEIRIVGPTFSGSAVSIRATLDEWFESPAGANRKVRIVSGTATAVGSALDDSRIAFHTVRIPDAAILPAVVADLAAGVASLQPKLIDLKPSASKAGVGPAPQIAILSDNTAYGSAAVAPGIRRMAFPLHISDLRTAFSGTAPASSPMSSGLAGGELPVVNEADQDDRDTIPRFSARTAAYNELVLETMLETIDRGHFRYVGVVATDVEDLVFLVRRIRDYCPNSIVFTTSSNLRFLHSDVNHQLDGVLVFSTYPLFTPNQDWTYPFRGEHLEFPSEDAEGLYNAALAIIGERGAMVEYGAPFARAGEVRGPALWVGVVGNNGIWPLGFQSLPEPALPGVLAADAVDGVHPALRLDLSVLYTTEMEAAFFVLSLLCMVPCYLVLRTEFVPARRRPERSWGEMVMGDAVLDEFRRERWMRISAFMGGWMMAYAVALIFLLLPLRAAFGITAGGRPHSDLIAAVHSMGFPAMLACATGIAVMIVLAAALGIALGRIRGPAADPPYLAGGVASAPTGAIFSLVGTAIGFVLIGIFLYCVWIQPAPFALLSFIRAANLRSSVSPLMPLVFLGVANLCLIGCDIWQLSLLEDCRMELPFLGFEDGGESFRGTGTYEREVTRLLVSPPWELPNVRFFLGFSLILLAAFATANGWPPIHSIDGAAFDWLFFLSAAFIYTYFSILLLRFVLVWSALHKLLRRLYWHPTRACYETLRVKSLPDRPEDQRIRVIEPPTSLTTMEFCLERARAMLRMGDGLSVDAARSATPAAQLVAARGKLEDDIRTAERRLAEVLAAQEKDGWQAALAKRVDAQQAIASISRRVIAILEPVWRLGDGRPPALGAVDGALLEQGELFIASRVVDFMRHIFIQLRGLAGFAMAGVLAMMLAISTYPFPNHNTLLWLSWVVLLAAIAINISVFVSINRDRVVSMLSGTAPGRFNWDSTIIVRMLLYGALPILALLGAQLPGGLGGVVSWIGGLFGGGAH